MYKITPNSNWWHLSDAQRLENKTINTLIYEFLNTKKSLQTKKAYEMDISSFFTSINVSSAWDLIAIPIYNLSKLIVDFTESFKKSEEYRKDRIENPRTVNRKAYALSSFFEFLVWTYGYPRNPVKVFTPYSTPSRTSTDDMSNEELQSIWEYVQTQAHSEWLKIKALLSLRQQMLIVWFLMLSLRRNEVATLKWTDRDKNKNTITVYGKWQKIKYLPLPSKINSYVEIFQELKKKHWYLSEYIFSPINTNRTWNSKKPITGTYIFNYIKKITTLLQGQWLIEKNKNITPHSFRTTFVKIALNKNATDIEIMNATGHSTSAMVKYYDARSPIEINAAKNMDDMF